MPFKTIAWATDGSEFADSALPLVTELAGKFGSKIVVVHANELFRGGRFGGGPLLADEQELRVRLEEQVNHLGELGFDARLDVETTNRHGTAHLIADAATAAGADLIVLATHGHGSAASLMLGGVAKELLHLAPCPVLTVPAARDRDSGAGLARVATG